MSPTYEIPLGRLTGRPAGIALAVILFLGGIWLYNWGQQCYGPEGQLHYQSHDWHGFFTDFGQGHDLGMMWLQEGQRVVVSYQANLPDRGTAYIWFGPVEEWVQRRFGMGFYLSQSRLSIDHGTGSLDFVAPKTGLYVVYYYTPFSHVSGEFTVSWRAL